MRWPFILISFLSIQVSYYAFADEHCDLNYSITHVPDSASEENHLVFNVKFSANDKNETIIKIPTQWAGAKGLNENIYDFKILNEGHEIIQNNSKKIVIKSSPNAEISLQYKIKFKTDHPFNPQVYADFFQFVGRTAFIYPAMSYSKENNVTLRWIMPQKKYRVINSFGEVSKTNEQKLKVSLNDLIDGIYLGGNLDIQYRDNKADKIAYAIYPKNMKNKEEYISLTQKTISMQRREMHESPIPYYLVSITDVNNHSNLKHFVGTNLLNSFIFLINDTNLYPPKLMDSSFTHEHFHYWIGRTILNDVNYLQTMWFSEGFTDFCSIWLAQKNGQISFDSYLASYNKMLKKYYSHPLKDIPNSVVSNEYWSIPILEILPYAKGHVFAQELNHQLSKNQSSVHRVILSVLKDNQNHVPIKYTDQNLLALLNQYTDNLAGAEWVKYFEEGKTINPSPDLFGNKAMLTWETIEVPYYGFNLQDTYQYKIVRGVDRDSRAYQLGLRDGQKIESIQFPNNKNGALKISLHIGLNESKEITVNSDFKEIKIPQYKM